MALADLCRRIREDARIVQVRDPAAPPGWQVVAFHPGFHAVVLHRIAHGLWRRDAFAVARFVAHLARFLTGVEIHPAAKVGRRLFIDHGMGVVVGQTAELGDDVCLFQGVTLGGTSTRKEKRHPTVEDGVVIGAGAVVLGRIRIGRSARVGAGSVVIADVPPHSTAVGVPARIAGGPEHPPADMEHGDLADPRAEALARLEARVRELERRLAGREGPGGPGAGAGAGPGAESVGDEPGVSLQATVDEGKL